MKSVLLQIIHKFLEIFERIFTPNSKTHGKLRSGTTSNGVNGDNVKKKPPQSTSESGNDAGPTDPSDTSSTNGRSVPTPDASEGDAEKKPPQSTSESGNDAGPTASSDTNSTNGRSVPTPDASEGDAEKKPPQSTSESGNDAGPTASSDTNSTNGRSVPTPDASEGDAEKKPPQSTSESGNDAGPTAPSDINSTNGRSAPTRDDSGDDVEKPLESIPESDNDAGPTAPSDTNSTDGRLAPTRDDSGGDVEEKPPESTPESDNDASPTVPSDTNSTNGRSVPTPDDSGDDNISYSWKKKEPLDLNPPHRENPESRWEMTSEYGVSISANFKYPDKESETPFPAGKPLDKGLELFFHAETNAPEGFKVYWQVVNTGAEAQDEWDLRGEIFEADGLGRGGLIQKESTKYRGVHWIECFIVIDGVCVARSDEFLVRVKGSKKTPRKRRRKLVCREDPDSWNVFLTASDECHIKEIRHDGKTLKMESSGEWNLSSFTGQLSLVFKDGAQDEISLFNGTPLIFKLNRGWKGDGRIISRITKGHFIVIAPGSWKRTGTPRFKPEKCKDSNFFAHYFFRDSGTQVEDIGGFEEYEGLLANFNLELTGETVFDDSEEGKLFVRSAPCLPKSRNIVWAEVGEEKKDGWEVQKFKPAEHTLKEILGNRQGHFFIRVYDDNRKLMDSDEFRYLQDLEEISVNGRMYTEHTILTPSADGHPPTKVQFNGVDGASLHPTLKPGVKHAKVDGGTLTVDPHPSVDDVSLTLESKTGNVDIVLRLPRIWWRMGYEAGNNGEWLDKPLIMTRKEFRQYATANAEMQLRLPWQINSVDVGFGDELDGQRTYWPKRTTSFASLRIPLNHFAYHTQIKHKLEKGTSLNIKIKCGDSDNIRIPLISVSADVISSPSIINGAQPEAVLKDGITYAIDMDELRRANMSFQYMVYSRLCRSEDCTFCKEHDLEYPMPAAATMIRGLSSGCSKQPIFLRPTMTLGEVVFRLLLKRNNKPASIKDVEAGMMEAWGDLIHLKNTARENTLGTLAGSNEYFIKRIDK